MVIMAKQAVLFVRHDGQNFYVPNGFIGQAPDWVTKTRQFKEMVADGMIVAAETSKDKDLDKASQKSGKGGKGGKGGKNSESAPEPDKQDETGDAESETGDTEIQDGDAQEQ